MNKVWRCNRCGAETKRITARSKRWRENHGLAAHRCEIVSQEILDNPWSSAQEGPPKGRRSRDRNFEEVVGL